MRVALFISGGGTTAQAIIESSQNGVLKNLVTPVVVIASKSGIGGIEKVKQSGIPIEIVDKNVYDDYTAFGDKLLTVLHHYNADFISQNGWLPLTPNNVIERYKERIINQHPGPLDPGRPDFGGKGMFGLRVICARILYCLLIKEKNPWTESTIHFVSEHIDKGDLIRVVEMQIQLPNGINSTLLNKKESVKETIVFLTKIIQEKLLPIEHENVIQVLAQFANGEVPIYKRKIALIPKENYAILEKAKKMAIKLFPNG
jgi:phosphoribosylglycinamide formyltransferase-1